jgi:hypothetical protein
LNRLELGQMTVFAKPNQFWRRSFGRASMYDVCGALDGDRWE